MNKNKLLAGFLAALLTAGLAGCGNTTQTAEKENGNPAPQAIQSADVTSDTEPSDDAALEEASPATETEPSSAEPIPTQTAEEKTRETPSEDQSLPNEQPAKHSTLSKRSCQRPQSLLRQNRKLPPSSKAQNPKSRNLTSAIGYPSPRTMRKASVWGLTARRCTAGITL